MIEQKAIDNLVSLVENMKQISQGLSYKVNVYGGVIRISADSIKKYEYQWHTLAAMSLISAVTDLPLKCRLSPDNYLEPFVEDAKYDTEKMFSSLNDKVKKFASENDMPYGHHVSFNRVPDTRTETASCWAELINVYCDGNIQVTSFGRDTLLYLYLSDSIEFEVKTDIKKYIRFPHRVTSGYGNMITRIVEAAFAITSPKPTEQAGEA